MTKLLSGEANSTLVSGLFHSETQAENVISSLVNDEDINVENIHLVKPQDEQVQKKLEPETKGIKQTLKKSHYRLGLCGALIGATLALLLIAFGLDALRDGKIVVIASLSVLGMFMGLIFAGAMSLRPDHELVIEKTRSASNSGEWAVIVHADSSADKERMTHAMRHYARSYAQSL